MDCNMPDIPVLHYLPELLKFASIESVMLTNHLILCHPLRLLTSVFPSITVFSSESALCIKWPTYWSFSFSISTSNEYLSWFPLGLLGLISSLFKGLSAPIRMVKIQKTGSPQMLVRRNRNAFSIYGNTNGKITWEDSSAISFKTKHKTQQLCS